MRCRYCNQRLNIFKSLSGSSFCSHEHQKLYEQAQAHTAFERLLEFVEKEPVLGAAKPALPPPVQQARQPAEPDLPVAAETDPPAAGFLLDPITSPAASMPVGANFEIPGPDDFPPGSPELPVWRAEAAVVEIEEPALVSADAPPVSPESPPVPLEVAPVLPEVEAISIEAVPVAPEPQPVLPEAGPVGESAPPPLAPWLSWSLAEIDTPQASIQVPIVGPVRPRAAALELPLIANPSLAPGPPSFLFSDEIPVCAGIDSTEVAKLARLIALHREARTADIPEHGLPVEPTVPGLAPANPAEFGVAPPVTIDGDVRINMAGAMTRGVVGRTVSPRPPCLGQPASAPGAATISEPIVPRLQDASASGDPVALPPRLKSVVPAVRQVSVEPWIKSLPQPAFANLKLDRRDKLTAMDMHEAMTRAGMARALREPQPPASETASAVERVEALRPVLAVVQNTPGPPDYTITASLIPPPECEVPSPAAPQTTARIAPVTAGRKLSLRESDTLAASGNLKAAEPAVASNPLCLPERSTSGNPVRLVANFVARTVPPEVQTRDGWQGCAMSAARSVWRECLLPSHRWTAKTWLQSASASAGWFGETNYPADSLQAGVPAERRFSIRFATPSFILVQPVIAFDRTARRLAIQTCEWQAKREELKNSRPPRTSPLSMVARPQAGVTPVVVRRVAKLRAFASISNEANRGLAPSAMVSASADEHNPTIALPAAAESNSPCAFQVSSSKAIAKSPAIALADCINTQVTAGGHSFALRVQPASMLVLPGSGATTPTRIIRRVTSVGWATVSPPMAPAGNPAEASSSDEPSLPSLQRLAAALRVDSAGIANVGLRLKAGESAIPLESGVQTPPPGVPAANALPRRRGPKLPVVTVQLGNLAITNR